MIAQVRFDGVEAELQNDGSWTCQDARYALWLNTRFNARAYPPSPSAGRSSYAGQIHALAQVKPVKVRWLVDPDQDQEGRVY